MKFLVTLLVAGLIAAAQGSQEPAPNAPTKWEEAVEKFWDLASQVLHSTESVLSNTQLQNRFRELITEGLSQLNTSAEDLRARLGPYSEQFHSDLEVLRDRLQRDLGSLQSTVEQYHTESQLLAQQGYSDLRHTLGVYLRKYRKRLTRDQEQIRHKFQEYQELLGDQGQRAVEGLRQAVDPVASATGTKLQEGLSALQQGFEQRLDQVRQQAHSFQQQAARDTQGLRQAVEDQMAALRDWFQSEAQAISHRFQELLDSVRQQQEEVN
ncbi:apolipoprotein Eb [Pristis pectinata]|uniref:apolipoprotein Eb n=1 Tax=Pristis pectinata TaxID=685728 RepID=UPI00223E1A53|nr:apolipoprotein Eb [Pristis pectinata]XP_051901506.1 apolipoprotein Eb [Pristis pectinata]